MCIACLRCSFGDGSEWLRRRRQQQLWNESRLFWSELLPLFQSRLAVYGSWILPGNKGKCALGWDTDRAYHIDGYRLARGSFIRPGRRPHHSCRKHIGHVWVDRTDDRGRWLGHNYRNRYGTDLDNP